MYDLQISSRIAFLLIFFSPCKRPLDRLSFSHWYSECSPGQKKKLIWSLSLNELVRRNACEEEKKTHVFNQPLFIWTTLLSGFFGIGSSQKTDYWSKSLVWRLLLSDRCIVLQIKPSTELQPSWERGPSFWNRECWCVLLLKFESLWDTDIISPR